MRNILLYVTMLLLWVCGCSHVEKPENKDDGRNEIELYEKWLVYNRPIDGYDVMIHWSCDKAQFYTGTGLF